MASLSCCVCLGWSFKFHPVASSISCLNVIMENLNLFYKCICAGGLIKRM